MALIGTHIRFALDLKDLLYVKDLDKYISGTIYPDSRYLTKIDRNLTHDKKFLDKCFYQNDDFKKGWFTHILCDQVQFRTYHEIFSDLLGNFKLDNKGKMSTNHWIYLTGLKILQDQHDITQFPLKGNLKHFKHFQTPNNEDSEIMKNYNQIFIDMYREDNIKISSAIDMWTKLGVDKKPLIQLEKLTQKMGLNQDILAMIKSVYSKIKDSSKEYLS